MVYVERAGMAHLNAIATLFDAYRQFYEQKPDLGLARNYIRERLINHQAIIFLAFDHDKRAVGFTLLYPTFCSVAAKHVFILYDLFVDPTARGGGAGEALLITAQGYAKEQNAAWLKLETAHTNKPAQALYEKLGWERDDEFRAYTYALDV